MRPCPEPLEAMVPDADARAAADALINSIAYAEHLVLATIERECEALRTGRLLAAEALQGRLMDASRLYLNAVRAARASLAAVAQTLPEMRDVLEEGRGVFAALLRIELAVLAAERAAAQPSSPAAVHPPAESARPEPARRAVPPRTGRGAGAKSKRAAYEQRRALGSL